MNRLFVFLFLPLFFSPNLAHAIDFITLTSSDVKLYTQDSEGSPPVDFKDNLFSMSFEILRRSGSFYQIKLTDSIKAYIKNDASYLKNIKESDYILAKRLPESKLTKKALIVNRPSQGGKFGSDINYFDNPETAGKYLGKISIFEIRYIFDETDTAYLVARTDRMKKITSDSVLVGWIAKNHIVEWNNLVGIEFDKTNYDKRQKCKIGQIFASEQEVADPNAKPIFKESETLNELPYYANRFPVLDKQTNNINYYKFAYIGNAYGSGGNVIDRKDIEKARHKIMQILSNNKVQIAILIDATKGMENHIANVKKAVRKFLGEFEGKEGMNANVAIAVYRDYPDGDKIYEIKSDFSQDIEKLRTAIDSVYVYSNSKDRGRGAYPEALFYGINKTIDNLTWKDSTKGGQYILLLGDHGNHKTYEQYPQDRVFSAPIIGQRLKDNIITLFALQVNISKEKQIYNQMFESQVLDIKQNNHGAGGLRKVSSNSSDAIYKELHGIVNDFSIIKDALIDVCNSKSQMSQIYKGVFTQKLLERYNIDAKVFDAVQICAIGYATLKNSCGDNQFFEKVLMTRKELESIKVQMQELSDAVMYYNPESTKKLERTIFMVVKALTGDELAPNENIAQFIMKKSGIPVNTQMLNMTVEQLLDRIQSGDFRKKLRKYIEERIMLLDGVVKEKDLQNMEWDKDDQRFIYNISDKPVAYFFCLEQPIPERQKGVAKHSKKNHAWVPLEYLP